MAGIDVNADGATFAPCNMANIDPCHNYPHRSPMSFRSRAPRHFTIQRHSVQQLLRQALDAAPGMVCGLLGGHDHNVGHVLPLSEGADQRMLQTAVEAWRKRGITLLASYASSAEASEHLSAGLPAIRELPLVNIRTDTLGRIEAELWSGPVADHRETWPLEMQEDGGLSSAGDKS